MKIPDDVMREVEKEGQKWTQSNQIECEFPKSMDCIQEVAFEAGAEFGYTLAQKKAEGLVEAMNRVVKGVDMHHKELEDDGKFMFDILNKALAKYRGE